MEPVQVPGFENLWITRDAQVFEGETPFSLLPLRVSCSSTYARVSVLVNGRRQRIHVHVLMAQAFLGLDPTKRGTQGDSLQVDHKDGNKRNNHIDNLEVVTKRENYRRAQGRGCYDRNGYASKGRPKMGLRRFSPADIDQMFELRNQGLSYREIGRRFGCDHKAVYQIIKGTTYQAWS